MTRDSDRIDEKSTPLLDPPLPASHKKIIRKRLADLDENPDRLVTWDEALEKISRRLDQA